MIMDRQHIEQQLFTWEDWGQDGPGDLQFSDVTLVTQVGEFPAGTKFEAAFWVGSGSLLVLIDKDEVNHIYELNVSVGNKIPQEDLHTDACDCGHDHG